MPSGMQQYSSKYNTYLQTMLKRINPTDLNSICIKTEQENILSTLRFEPGLISWMNADALANSATQPLFTDSILFFLTIFVSVFHLGLKNVQANQKYCNSIHLSII
jgi:hypothetical protein